ncbi:MAG: IS110 family transposase, partial [Motiliproteus sp.]
MNISVIGLDIAKSVFHLFAVNRAGKLVRKKMLKRHEVAAYFSRLEPCVVAMEACGSANYWARVLKAQGHDVKLIAPQYVKPFVKGNKNDYNDAEAIAEAAQRPRMRFVPIKSVEQQDVQMIHRQHDRLTKDRTALVNQIRGLLAEYGIIIKKSVAAVRNEMPRIFDDSESGLSVLAKETFNALYNELVEQDTKLKQCLQKIHALNKSLESCQRLQEVTGIGPLTATAVFAAAGNGHDFVNGRHFSAWLG